MRDEVLWVIPKSLLRVCGRCTCDLLDCTRGVSGFASTTKHCMDTTSEIGSLSARNVGSAGKTKDQPSAIIRISREYRQPHAMQLETELASQYL